ncbi:hypothetical protein BX666DRAFT_2011755 [Dichotomocladium elegans]|nr:hypothetical protein BX666DRAFT_2011755 [Dichotomocladium elegans]
MDDERRLNDFLRHHHIKESNEESIKRQNVIQELKALLPHFIARTHQRDVGDCQLLPFGSYGIGGYIAGADIDLVCLAPSTISRKVFFKNFPRLLSKMPNTKGIESIKRAAVPIIKCTVDSFSIDISFVSLKLRTVPSDINLLDDELLTDLDEVCVASMDGPRTHQFIMSNIFPQHLRFFRPALQVIKHWAMQRALYGKPLGYLNDWSTWDWHQPVMLTEAIPTLMDQTHIAYEELEEFKTALMPIMSPCFPVCNAAPFVTRSTRRVIMDELQRAAKILSYYSHDDLPSMLHKLFHKLNIFKKYIHFLQIAVTAESVKSRDTWVRKMATNVPRLVQLLEDHPDVRSIHPYTTPLIQRHQYRTDQEKLAIQVGDFDFKDIHDDIVTPGWIHSICYLIGITVGLSDGE